MIVPKQLANTMEFIFERSMPAIGTVVAIVIGPPLVGEIPPGKAQEMRGNGGNTAKH
jgi:hypothetical protein